MMKKARKVAGDQTLLKASYQVAAEDGRARIKIRSLAQDYESLAKETEATKKRLLDAKKKKQNLLAQVKFLRKKYKSFMENPHQNNLYKLNYDSQQAGPSTARLPLKSQRTSPVYGAHLQNLGSGSEFAWKGRSHNERKTLASTATASFDLNESAFNPPKPPQYRRISPVMQMGDFQERESSHRGKEIAATSMSGMLDLNQVAMPAAEEEEYRSTWEAPLWERPVKQFTLDADRTSADLKLAACRNAGEPPSRSGKRKISWQDQVVLRV